MEVRVRFAPSPTGELHVGNVRTALFNWLYARQTGGAFVLRIEDTDADRSEGRYEAQLLEDLSWLGLNWDEGVDIGGDFSPYRQTERFPLYRKKAEELLSRGRAYYCFCSQDELDQTRERQRRAGESIRYSGKCATIPAEVAANRVGSGEKATVRLHVGKGRIGFDDLVFGPIEVDRETIGDFILLRSDGSSQYNFACANDDHAMRITHVIRGEGHISNTHRQLLVYEALGYSAPRFAHLSTILGPDGMKLSKRHGATSVDAFRTQGFLSNALVNYLALLGWTPREEQHEIFSIEELISQFELERVTKSPATFDLEKLKWVNRAHLKQLDEAELVSETTPFLVNSGLLPDSASPQVRDFARDLVKTLFKYADTLSDFGQKAAELLDFRPNESLKDPEVEEILSRKGAIKVIRLLNQQLSKVTGEVTYDVYRECVLKVKEVSGEKGKDLFRPVRVAVTAKASGPELDMVIPILETAARLDLPNPVAGVRKRVASVTKWLEIHSE